MVDSCRALAWWVSRWSLPWYFSSNSSYWDRATCWDILSRLSTVGDCLTSPRAPALAGDFSPPATSRRSRCLRMASRSRVATLRVR